MRQPSRRRPTREAHHETEGRSSWRGPGSCGTHHAAPRLSSAVAMASRGRPAAPTGTDRRRWISRRHYSWPGPLGCRDAQARHPLRARLGGRAIGAGPLLILRERTGEPRGFASAMTQGASKPLVKMRSLSASTSRLADRAGKPAMLTVDPSTDPDAARPRLLEAVNW